VKSNLQLLRRIFGLSLTLFPKNYREEYGAELQAVFDLSLDDAIAKGAFEAAKLVVSELISLPKAVVFAHLRQRRNVKMIKRFDSYFDFACGSWKEFLTALLPFFLVGVAIPLLNVLVRLKLIPTSGILGTLIPLALFGLFIILFILGVKKGMPRWFMPYLGFLLAMLSVYLFSAVFGTPIYLLFHNLRDQSLLVIDILWSGIFWYGLLTAMILLVALTRTSPAFQHFRNDWTLLCFVIYGATPFAVWLTFDEYAGDEPYTLLAFLVLACGSWLFLRTENEWTRFGTLFAAMTLAMFIVTAAKAILVPIQTWPITIDAGLARAEVKGTVMMWGWFVLGMLIPLGIKFRPHSDASIHVSASEG
jgi:hypothetical protein